MTERSESFNLIPKILNGGIAGWIGIACVFPLDLVKTRLQKQQVGPDGQKIYNSIFDAFRKIYKTEGIRGMYRGSAVLMLLVTPEKAIKLSSNDFFRYHLRTQDRRLPMWRQILAGGITGVVQIVVTTPMELLKIQLQDAGRVAAKDEAIRAVAPKLSATRLAIDLIKERGFFGLYKGTWATILRDVPFCVVYFPLFANLDALGPRKKDGSGDAVFWCSFLSGLTAGMISAFIVTPFDVMKTRIQTITQQPKGERSHTSIAQAFTDILKFEGYTAFFKGGACRMMVIAPLYAIIQTVYYVGVAEWILGIQKDVKSK